MNDRRRNTVRIDYDKLAEAIVKANLKTDEELKELEENEREELQQKWENVLGYNDDLKGKEKICNNLKIFWNILFFKKENVLTLVANNALLKMILAGLYIIIEILLYTFAIFGIGIIVVLFINKNYGSGIMAILVPFISFTIARIVRMARFEIDIINDKNYLATLFAAIISFVALIASAIAIVISIIYK